MLCPDLPPDREEPQQGGKASSAFHSPAVRRGRPAPATSQLAVIWHLQLPGKEAGESRKGTAGAGPLAGRAKASSAQPSGNQGSKEAEV